MATYFHGPGSDIQASSDGLLTLHTNSNNCVPYSDNSQYPATTNMFLLNPSSAGNALNPFNLSHAPSPASHQPFFGITLPPNIAGSSNSEDQRRSILFSHPEISGIQGLSAPPIQYHLWGPVMDQTASAAGGTVPAYSGGVPVTTGTVEVVPQMGFRRPSQQGLSLSLSSQQAPNRSLSGEVHVQANGHLQVLSPTSDGGDDICERAANSRPSMSNGNIRTAMHSVTSGSVYLKAAQELLNELVPGGDELSKVETMCKEKIKMTIESKTAVEDLSCGTSDNKEGTELATAQRQELQMKKSKLVSMLDEVEQRYRQYRHQMQIAVSSFEQAAGLGAAKSYTDLALKTISKRFRCLKDVISSQIKSTSHRLGEDDFLAAKLEGSRLRFVDHQLRQQKLQQMGMIQHNVWRPQRGLPERAVSVLRAWLFEHFLHPYPKDSDKLLLAKQTGLTRSQVSNWFINARVRLWKPMVEEMYMEEVKEHERNNSGEDSSRSKQPDRGLAQNVKPSRVVKQDHMKPLQSSKPDNFSHQNVSPTETSNSSIPTPALGSPRSQSGFMLLGSCDMKRSPTKRRNCEMQSSVMWADMDKKPRETNTEAITRFGIHDRQSKDGFSFISENPNQGGVAYGAYSMADLGSFHPEQLAPRLHGNGVSLTLALPHSENLPISGNQHGMRYLSQPNMQLGRLGMGGNGSKIDTPHSSYSSNGFDNMDIPNRKSFDAHPSLPDFVA